MSHLALSDEHLEVLYILMNDEHDTKYFFPHFYNSCQELAAAGYIQFLNRKTDVKRLQICPAGLKAFTTHFNTSSVIVALRAKVEKEPLTEDHYKVLCRLLTSSPISADSLDNELIAYDLVNLSYAINIFPRSGKTYYSQTRQGYKAFCDHYKTDNVEEAIAIFNSTAHA